MAQYGCELAGLPLVVAGWRARRGAPSARDADTSADAGVTIASLDDKLCRVLVSGDVEGDGRKEIVAAALHDWNPS